MTSENELKFKYGRIWKARHVPCNTPCLAERGIGKTVFDDVTLEVARALKDALDMDAEGKYQRHENIDLSLLDD